ncbi:MAG: histidinol-phosphatase HisJ [Anaerolineae bacterium]
MISVDYHTHHNRCGHAQGHIEDYIRSGLNKGLLEIGISDHAPIFWKDGDDPMPTIAMAKSELDGYVDEVLRLKAKYAGQIEVRLGLEVDYVEGMEDEYRAILSKYPWDYLIGSVHFVKDRNVYDVRRWDGVADVMPIFVEYYRLVVKSARAGLFDILAHTTAVTAYAPKPIPSAIEPLQDAALEAIAASGICVEINTSGYRKMTTDPFPTVRMIKKAHHLGIPLTFSSDAHRPEDVTYAADRIEGLLEEMGVTEIAAFEGRHRRMVSIAAPAKVYQI